MPDVTKVPAYEDPDHIEAIDFSEEPEAVFFMDPKKFMLWLFIMSIVMIFASLTSAYIVRQSEGEWLDFALPEMLWYSSGIILLSSLTMQWALWAGKKDQILQLKLALWITALLGIGFLVMQWEGWVELVRNGIFFGGVNSLGEAVNVSGSFVYVLMGVHAAHLITGLIFLGFILVGAHRYKIHSKSINSLEMCTIYWHFLDGLWIYLFLFLLLTRN